ncbi:proline-rich protein 2-like [Mustela erminea]|uniref:proline-rich protein 2-like n=1 Tax=Mustela erminea TaxID=36723 RepID=UPI0013874A5D|nr:proline-rich protein 2-like [Mustela erminea]
MEARPQGSLVIARASRSQGLPARDWGVPVPSSLRPRSPDPQPLLPQIQKSRPPAPPPSDLGVQTPNPLLPHTQESGPQSLLPQTHESRPLAPSFFRPGVQGSQLLFPPSISSQPSLRFLGGGGCWFPSQLLPGPHLSPLLLCPSFLYLDPMTFYLHISPSGGPPLWGGKGPPGPGSGDMSCLSPRPPCFGVRRSAAAGLVRGQANPPPSDTFIETAGPPGCGNPQAQPRGLGADRRQLRPLQGHEGISPELPEPGIPAWLWAHRICQQPSPSTWPHPTPPASLQGHCLPQLPKPPRWAPPSHPSHCIQGKTVLGLLYPKSQPAPSLSSRDLTLPIPCSKLSMAAANPQDRGQGPQLVSQVPQVWLCHHAHRRLAPRLLSQL